MTSPLGGRAAGPGPLGSEQFTQLARDLKRMSVGTRRAVARRFKAIGQPLLADARRRAGWSTRIPDAISVRGIADQRTARVGVELRISARKAPHGRPYEGLNNQGNEGYFRHPVYGNEDVWVSQTTRPFAYPAVVAKRVEAERAVLAAWEDAAREAGFR